MKHALTFTLALILFAPLATLRAAEPVPPEGFRAIFNGKDLTGWHGLNPHSVAKLTGEKREANLKQQRAEFPKHWRVENGELVNDGNGPLRHDRRGVRRHRVAHRIQDRAEGRQRHLSARHAAGADLGLEPGLRSQEPDPQTAPGLRRPVQQHARHARPRSAGAGRQAVRRVEQLPHPPDRRPHLGVAERQARRRRRRDGELLGPLEAAARQGPDHAADPRRRNPLAQPLRARHQPPSRPRSVSRKDVTYLEPDRAEKADLYLPPIFEPGKKYPGIVIIHGGGWTGGDKGAAREINIGTTLASHGYVCMSINYALAKAGSPTFPQNIQECKRAVRWLRKNADRFQLDADAHRGHRRLGGRASDGPAGGERAGGGNRSRGGCGVLLPHPGRGADVPPLRRLVGGTGAAETLSEPAHVRPAAGRGAGSVGLGLADQAALEGRSAHADPARHGRQDHAARSVHAFSRGGQGRSACRVS